MIVVDHSCKFRAIYLTLNLALMDCNTENGGTLLELPDNWTISGKNKKEIIVGHWEKGK